MSKSQGPLLNEGILQCDAWVFTYHLLLRSVSHLWNLDYLVGIGICLELRVLQGVVAKGNSRLGRGVLQRRVHHSQPINQPVACSW